MTDKERADFLYDALLLCEDYALFAVVEAATGDRAAVDLAVNELREHVERALARVAADRARQPSIRVETQQGTQVSVTVEISSGSPSPEPAPPGPPRHLFLVADDDDDGPEAG